MKLVIPVSHVDLEMAKLLAARIVALGGMQDEHVIVVSTMKAAWDVEPLMATLRPGFKQADLHVLPDECEEGWPESANHLFYGGATMLYDYDEPFYWFEADCFPVRPGWWEEFRAEYFDVGAPYMGYVNTSRFYEHGSTQVIEDGRHMVGTGIYPAKFMYSCRSIHFLTRIPWDVYIGPEVAPQCHHTDLIAHRWGTCNYRMEGGQLVCDNTKHDWHKYAAPIPPGAAVIHGSKDSSLYKVFEAN